MALVKTGSFTRSYGIIESIIKHLRLVNYEPVKRITVQFDPFGENAKSMREFLYFANFKKVQLTNPYCNIQAKIICDRREPTVEVLLNNGDSVLLKCNHLNTLDMIKIFNQHVSSLIPKEQPTKGTVSLSRK